MVKKFSSANNDRQIGIEFLSAGVAIAQVHSGKKLPGRVLSSDFLPAIGQEAQARALQEWVQSKDLQKCSCVCLMSTDDFNIHQVERPKVEDAELIPALTWRIKDLITYDVGSAVVDFYPMPISHKNNTQQVSVVTAQDSTVAAYVECIKSSGLKLVAIDVPSLAGSNLTKVQQATGQTLAVLSLTEFSGYLNIFHDTDLYVSRDFKIGTSKLAQVTDEDEWTYDSLLLEIQRSMDYFESYYGLGSVSKLLIFPKVPATEKLIMYLKKLTSFDIDFVTENDSEAGVALEAHCFHAYGAALRGIKQ
ncbi:MAG: MSHA biogenesis protein MshI [Gammaproteobacteria bacterium]|jgi:MSHA biogenesis protein MshI